MDHALSLAPEILRMCLLVIVFVGQYVLIIPHCLAISDNRLVVFLIALAIQLVVTVVALVCEPREDPQFEGEKLIYRS